MDLRKLRHMLVLSEELNFARAAQRVNLTQSALSRSIQSLEDELGGKLFDRNLHGVVLTSVGQQVARRARELLLHASNLRHEVEQMQRHELGDIRLGVGPIPAATFLPVAMAELMASYPQLKTEVQINNRDNLLTLLLNEQIEFFIADTHNYVIDKRIFIEPIARQYGGIFCRPDHPLNKKIIQHQSEVLAYPLAAVHLPDAVKKELSDYFGLPDGQEFSISLTCDNPGMLHYVCQHSDGILLTTFGVIGAELSSGSLVELSLPEQPQVYADMGVVRLSGRSLSPSANWLIQRIRHHVSASLTGTENKS
ncbi:MAG: LysR family transcriptional regulator [Burkholderiales bacterium]|nr:LysR family transcriptional regulator [Burkholderiales bacterium]